MVHYNTYKLRRKMLTESLSPEEDGVSKILSIKLD